ncbi:tRNA (adenosine(37)-N6)-dimethylallyltransferase MiaA [Ornithinibacillus sp. L9]|uniref:tRNA dimethylallyltransferase n=1 Tax=Ornithinibacillus caprae TaxID=2678566 RepID=A0A6N8FMM0_9BACI|nr:tRNA (adenosine(37)-N6)-dimethylallyltransferase MiaA [Ornithinibacillus caprae]MUK90725.1 tRNA (adenosine(37)-N6)-dimethylallyltransferase MiaA [Ornithinibacillus caprae]
MKNKVVAIVGPTAVGKTKLSLEVAKQFDGEIISGDSMQVYKGMDIGTAKIKKQEMQGIPHHLIDIRNPDESFSVADFKECVQTYIDEISNNNKLPIIVGGSGLYIQATLFDYNFATKKRDETITKRLEEELKRNGNEALYHRLKKIDPIQAEKIHPNNYRRVIRALEIVETTGLTMSEYHANQSNESPYDVQLIGLEMDRKTLYDRINKRVDQMVEEGIVEEVRHLYEQGYENCQSMKAIGYKEFLPYFKGEINLDQAIQILKQNSRRYAKRQYTWFKNKMDVHWYTITPETIDDKIQIISQDLAGFLKER